MRPPPGRPSRTLRAPPRRAPPLIGPPPPPLRTARRGAAAAAGAIACAAAAAPRPPSRRCLGWRWATGWPTAGRLPTPPTRGRRASLRAACRGRTAAPIGCLALCQALSARTRSTTCSTRSSPPAAPSRRSTSWARRCCASSSTRLPRRLCRCSSRPRPRRGFARRRGATAPPRRRGRRPRRSLGAPLLSATRTRSATRAGRTWRPGCLPWGYQAPPALRARLARRGGRAEATFRWAGCRRPHWPTGAASASPRAAPSTTIASGAWASVQPALPEFDERRRRRGSILRCITATPLPFPVGPPRRCSPSVFKTDAAPPSDLPRAPAFSEFFPYGLRYRVATPR
mmetsp:Transcript_2665/g.9280  ORF Transcript_2665/g.9280 Transcript_2665/m.9280 type:complete len:342 (-) Transcript_2665:77-1102(-)